MNDAKHLCEIPGESPANRQQLAGLSLELKTNQAVLDGLLNCYSVFAFTGGTVPSGQYELVAVNSYLKLPFATDCISTEEVEHYRSLIESITIPRKEISPRPRTLRGRKQIADAFERVASEIRSLGSRFESALMITGPVSFSIVQRLIHGSTIGRPGNFKRKYHNEPIFCVDTPFGHGRKGASREHRKHHVASQSA